MAKDTRPRRQMGAQLEQQLKTKLGSHSSIAGAVLPSAIPDVEAPDLGTISVVVPMAEDVTQDDLILRFEALRRAHAIHVDRAEDEPVQPGDDVLVDFVVYSDGALVPRSLRHHEWLTDEADVFLPGLRDALVGTVPGTSKAVTLTLPAHYPVPSLAGSEVAFSVDILAARSVTLPNPEDPGFVDALRMGRSLDEVFDALQLQLEGERADELLAEARDRVFDELLARVPVEVPGSIVDEEIRRRWSASEGHVMAQKSFTPAEQEEALQGWLRDPELRAESARRLAISVILRAIALRDGLELDEEIFESFLEGYAGQMHIPVEEVRHALLEDPGIKRSISHNLFHLLVVEHVMGQVNLTFEGAEDIRPENFMHDDERASLPA